MVGEVLGSFRLLDEIGHGGMGTVYLAEHVLLGRRAAVKVLQEQWSRDQIVVTRFFNEARAAASIAHPGIVDVFDFGHHEGRAFLVMEHLVGETLQQGLEREGRMALDRALAMARQMAVAVAAAHAKGIIHRDLKPDNVFLCPEPELPFETRVKILDFGIAKLSSDFDSPLKTQSTAILGTPSYMSPEQCKGAGKVDSRCDVYALGCILFRMLCGRQPFVGQGTGEVMAAHIYEAPERPSRLNGLVTPAVDDLILRALAKKPEERQQSMAHFAAEVDAAAGGRPQRGSSGTSPSLRLGDRPASSPPPPAEVEPTVAGPTTAAGPGRFLLLEGRDAEGVIASFGAHAGTSPRRVCGYPTAAGRRYAVLLEQGGGARWWWYAGLDAGALSERLNDHHARPLQVESHGEGAGRRFDALLIDNTGPGGRGWWWYHGLDAATVDRRLAEHGARVDGLYPFIEHDQLRFTVTLAPAEGRQAALAPELGGDDVAARCQASRGEPTALRSYVHRGERRFALALAAAGPARWSFAAGVDGKEASAILSRAADLIDFDVITDGGAPRYALVVRTE